MSTFGCRCNDFEDLIILKVCVGQIGVFYGNFLDDLLHFGFSGTFLKLEIFLEEFS